MGQPGISINLRVKIIDQGFTLLESLVALIILGILMAGGTAFFYKSNALYYRGLHSQMATREADTVLEQIKGTGCTNWTPPSTWTAAASDTNTIGLSGNWSDTTHLTGTLKVVWPTTLPASSPCSLATTRATCSSSNIVAVCVSWTEPGETAASNQTISLETYVGQ